MPPFPPFKDMCLERVGKKKLSLAKWRTGGQRTHWQADENPLIDTSCKSAAKPNAEETVVTQSIMYASPPRPPFLFFDLKKKN